MITEIEKPVSKAETFDMTFFADAEYTPISFRSAKQPPRIGYPFVIHAPEEVIAAVGPIMKRLVELKRIKVSMECPKFLRTDIQIVRIAMNYGDAATASQVHQLLIERSKSLVFKNWL